jgi:uncharacterized protein YpuA (DUF1002 family)
MNNAKVRKGLVMALNNVNVNLTPEQLDEVMNTIARYA